MLDYHPKPQDFKKVGQKWQIFFWGGIICIYIYTRVLYLSIYLSIYLYLYIYFYIYIYIYIYILVHMDTYLL